MPSLNTSKIIRILPGTLVNSSAKLGDYAGPAPRNPECSKLHLAGLILPGAERWVDAMSSFDVRVGMIVVNGALAAMALNMVD